MGRRALVLLAAGVLSCSHEPAYWKGISLPQYASVLAEGSSPEEGDFIHLRIHAKGRVKEVHRYFEQTLDAQWEPCFLAHVDPTWEDDHYHRAGRYSMWVNRSEGRLLRVASVWTTGPDQPLGPDEPDLAINHLASDSRFWDLAYRIICDQHDPELFSPFAAGNASKHYCRDDPEAIPFDAGRWVTADPAQRGRMTPDLLCRGLLLGLDKEQVVILLGPPDLDKGPEFSYRISKPDNFGSRYLPPPRGGIVCREGEYDLRFDFTTYVPDGGPMPFEVAMVCLRPGD